MLAATSTAHAYRTAADLPEYPDDARIALARGELNINLYERVPDGLTAAEVLAELEAAAAEWNSVACPNGGRVELRVLGTTPGAAASDGSVTIQFVQNDWVLSGFEASAVATTEVTIVTDGDATYIAEADIFVRGDAGVRWTTNGSEGAIDLRAMLTHELGHVIGLGHSEDATATMYAYDRSRDAGSIEARSLAEDDRLGYCFLNDPACPASGCGEGRECVRGVCVSSCASGPCAPGAECVDAVCTPSSCPPETCGPSCELACASRRGDLGDPCTTARECRSGRCGESGLCTSACRTATACPASFDCVSGECAPQLSPFGEVCRVPSECTGDVCVLEVGSVDGFCSRECASAAANCPTGHLCNAVDGTDVCIPELPPDGGCSAAGNHEALLPALLIPILALRRKRRP